MSLVDAMAETGIKAFLESLAYKLQIEGAATTQTINTVTAFLYSSDIFHPWPREFSFRKELYTTHSSVWQIEASVRELISIDEEHVLNVFGNEVEAIKQVYGGLGYQFAWTNQLMGRELTSEDVEDAQGAGTVREMTAGDVMMLQIEHEVSALSLKANHIHNYVVEIGGELAGIGQLVTVAPTVAYIADMYTMSAHRRMGVGRQLLQWMHRMAFSLGKTQAVLLPSLMTRQIGFYEKYGYEDAVAMNLLIPKKHTVN